MSQFSRLNSTPLAERLFALQEIGAKKTTWHDGDGTPKQVWAMNDPTEGLEEIQIALMEEKDFEDILFNWELDK